MHSCGAQCPLELFGTNRLSAALRAALKTETDQDVALKELRDAVREAIAELQRFGASDYAVRSALESIARQTLSADAMPGGDTQAGIDLVDEIGRRYLENEPPRE